VRHFCVLILFVVAGVVKAAGHGGDLQLEHPTVACEGQPEIKGKARYVPNPFGSECTIGPFTITITATQIQKKGIITRQVVIGGLSPKAWGDVVFPLKDVFKKTNTKGGLPGTINISASVSEGAIPCDVAESEITVTPEPRVSIKKMSSDFASDIVEISGFGMNKPESGQISFSVQHIPSNNCNATFGTPQSNSTLADAGTWATVDPIVILSTGDAIGCKFKVTVTFIPTGAQDPCKAMDDKTVTIR